ncbi:hypothetical protein LINGRAHAP2_LOCUS4466, partial [Linum grandiflorum]
MDYQTEQMLTSKEEAAPPLLMKSDRAGPGARSGRDPSLD